MKGRPKGPDKIKVAKILTVLYRYPDGVWFRRLCKESKLSISTIHFYLDQYLSNFIENIGYKDGEGHYIGIRVIRLKQGTTLEQIMKYHEVKQQIKSS